MNFNKIYSFSRKDYLLLIFIPLVYFIFIITNFDLKPIIYPDSLGYIEFNPVRTLGYPLLIHLIGLKSIIQAQIIIFTIALFFLGFEVYKITNKLNETIILLCSICITPDLINTHLSLLTESFFLSLIIIVIAALINVVYKFNFTYLLIASFAVGLASVIRPIGYGILPVIILFVLLNLEARKFILISLICILLPSLVVILSERTVANIKFKDNIDSLTPRHLFAKSSMLKGVQNTILQAPDELTEKLIKFQNEESEKIRKFIKEAPTKEVRNILTIYYEQCIQYRCFLNEIYSFNNLSRSKENEIILRVALDRILKEPTETFELFLIHYKSLWTMYQVRHPDVVDVFNNYIENNKYLPLDNAIRQNIPKKFLPFHIGKYIQWFMILIGWSTFFIFVIYLTYSLRRIKTPPLLTVAGVTAFLIHIEFSFTAFFGLGISRYSILFFPIMIISIYFMYRHLLNLYLFQKN
jgi:hypothetical protein